MTLPICNARRTLDPVAELYYCRHPQVHARHQLVDGPQCRSCRRSDVDTPQGQLRPFPPTANVPQNGSTIGILTVTAGETPSWLTRLAVNSTAVRRIDVRDDFAVGGFKQRAIRALLDHIVDNYESLPEGLAFVPLSDQDPSHEQAESLNSTRATHAFQTLGGTYMVEDLSSSNAVGALFERLFDAPPPAYFAFQTGSGFVVSRAAIRGRPVSFYRRLAALVDETPSAADSLERLWPYVFRTAGSATYGVVTAADGRYFDQLLIFLQSLQAVNAPPVLVFQQGFSAGQIGELLEIRHVELRPFPRLCNALAPLWDEPKAVAWLKPWWLLHSPFDRTLWIDADCVVLKPLEPVFEALADGPFVVVDPFPHFAENPTALFEHPSLQLQVSKQVGVNSGVFGWDRTRDRELLAAWAWAVQLAASDDALRQLSANQDQGLLIWALHRMSLHGCARSDDAWNRLPDRDFQILGEALRRGCSPMQALSERYPDAGILHWMAVPKLPDLMHAEMLRLFARGAAKEIAT